MDIYDRLIENPLFFKWIFYPSEELNSYWAGYLEQNPHELDQVLEFKSQFEKYLKFDLKHISETDKKKLAVKIKKRLESVDARKKRFLIVRSFIKYAAVAFMFFITTLAVTFGQLRV